MNIDVEDIKKCYLKVEKPLMLLRGNMLLRDAGIRNGKSIIEHQLGNKRIPVVEYQQGSIGFMCDYVNLCKDFEAVNDVNSSIQKSDGFEDAKYLVLNRDIIIKEGK